VPGYDEAHGELHNEDVAHEHSDINVRSILTFALAVTIVGILAAAGMAGLFHLFQKQAAANEPRITPLAMPATKMPSTTAGSPVFSPAPQPQLLTNEPMALRQLHQTEDQQLHQYGWVDQNAGVARVPIEQAKKLLIERGLPARAGGVDPKLGTDAPAYGESSGGTAIPTGAAGQPHAQGEPVTPAPAGQAAPADQKAPAAPQGRGGAK
jgi:hypothetical protein